jgi:hypothetical protein
MSKFKIKFVVTIAVATEHAALVYVPLQGPNVPFVQTRVWFSETQVRPSSTSALWNIILDCVSLCRVVPQLAGGLTVQIVSVNVPVQLPKLPFEQMRVCVSALQMVPYGTVAD